MTKRWIRRETTATTIADAHRSLTQTGTNVSLERIAVSPDPDPHTSDAAAPHVPSASAAARCPAITRVVSTGRVTVAVHPHPDHRPCPPLLLLCPRCSHRRDHPLIHHRHGTTDTPHSDPPTVTYEGNTAAITTTGATATASGSHTHLRHLCPVPLPSQPHHQQNQAR